MNLLSGREVVGELSRLGVGTWTPDAVRQWIREDPACPVAERADRGKPNRFRMIEVLQWLLDRERRAKARGYTSTANSQLGERLEVALRHFVAGTLPPAPSAGPVEVAGGLASTDLEVSPAKHEVPLPTDWESLTDVDAVLAVLRGSQPGNWKAVEEALNQRRRRLEAEGKLVAVEEIEEMLSAQALAVRSALQSLVISVAQRISDQSSFDQRRATLQTAIDDVLTRLSRDDQDGAPGLADAA